VDFRSYEFIAYQPSTTIHFVRTDVAPGLKEPADIVKAKGLIAGGFEPRHLERTFRLRFGLACWACRSSTSPAIGRAPAGAARVAARRNSHILESPPSYRSVVVPQLIKTGQANPGLVTTRSWIRRPRRSSSKG